MASTPTTRLELNKQGLNDNAGTWGTKLNVNFDMIDLAIAGRAAITRAGSTVTLTDDDYEADQSRALFLDLSGTSGDIQIPAREKFYIVRNNSSTIASITNGSGGVNVPVGTIVEMYTDGTSYHVVSRKGWGLFNSTAASGTSLSFNASDNITTDLRDIRLVLKGLGQASGTQALEIGISDDGSTWSTYDAIGAGTYGTSVTLYGAIEIFGIKQDAGVIRASFADLTANRTTGSYTGESLPWRLTNGIKSVRFQMGGSTLDKGTVELWGR